MANTDKEVLELCKSWFEDIMERCDRLTSGNVSHGSRAIRGIAKNYAEYVDEHLHNRWKPSEEQIIDLEKAFYDFIPSSYKEIRVSLEKLLKQLKEL